MKEIELAFFDINIIPYINKAEEGTFIYFRENLSKNGSYFLSLIEDGVKELPKCKVLSTYSMFTPYDENG